VRWIEIQDLFFEHYKFERFVETGPSPTLTGRVGHGCDGFGYGVGPGALCHTVNGLRLSNIHAHGIANLGCLFILGAGMLMLLYVFPQSPPSSQETPPTIHIPFSAGSPIYSHFMTKHQSKGGAFNYGGMTASGQVPELPNNIALIDPATPQSAYTTRCGTLCSPTSLTSMGERSGQGMTHTGRQLI
jgi:hypothetical protein